MAIQRAIKTGSSHRRCSVETMLLKLLQYSLENTYVGVFFLIKLRTAASVRLVLYYQFQERKLCLTTEQQQGQLKAIKLKIFRSSPSEVSVRKSVMKTCSKFTGEQPCRSVVLIKLQSSFIEVALRHGCSPVNLLHIFISEHFFLRTSREDCFRFFKKSSIMWNKEKEA